jgi:hypothetical protein
MVSHHATKAINGHEYNRETADRFLIARRLLVPFGQGDITVEMELPIYLAGKLRQDNWDRVQARLEKYVGIIAPQAALLGVPAIAVETLVSTAARKAIYDEFCSRQAEIGNESWAVPMTLFEDQYPGVKNV